jgi:hypothetical protein
MDSAINPSTAIGQNLGFVPPKLPAPVITSIPASQDLFELRHYIDQRAQSMSKVPFWQRPMAYLKNAPKDFLRSIDPRPLLGSTPSQIKAALQREFKYLAKPTSGLFALGMDLLFTAVPNTWNKLKKGDVMGALGELGKGTVLSAGGLAATAAVAALFPAIGIPGFLLSNVAYDMGKKLVSAVTGLKQDNGSAEPAPFIDPSRMPAMLSQQSGEAMPQAMAQTAASMPPPTGNIQQTWASLPPESQQAVAHALQQSGSNVNALLS